MFCRRSPYLFVQVPQSLLLFDSAPSFPENSRVLERAKPTAKLIAAFLEF